jgi:hypothetical protein
MNDELQKPCSEIEIAEAMSVLSVFIGTNMPSYKVLRRLAFERDKLIQQRDDLLAACESALLMIGEYQYHPVSRQLMEAIKKAKGEHAI